MHQRTACSYITPFSTYKTHWLQLRTKLKIAKATLFSSDICTTLTFRKCNCSMMKLTPRSVLTILVKTKLIDVRLRTANLKMTLERMDGFTHNSSVLLLFRQSQTLTNSTSKLCKNHIVGFTFM